MSFGTQAVLSDFRPTPKHVGGPWRYPCSNPSICWAPEYGPNLQGYMNHRRWIYSWIAASRRCRGSPQSLRGRQPRALHWPVDSPLWWRGIFRWTLHRPLCWSSGSPLHTTGRWEPFLAGSCRAVALPGAGISLLGTLQWPETLKSNKDPDHHGS